MIYLLYTHGPSPNGIALKMRGLQIVSNVQLITQVREYIYISDGSVAYEWMMLCIMKRGLAMAKTSLEPCTFVFSFAQVLAHRFHTC